MRELVLACSRSQADVWSDALLQAGALAVSIEDADRDTAHEEALFGEPGTESGFQAWQRSRLLVLLADGQDPAQLLAVLPDSQAVQPGHEGAGWFLREVPDADWVRLTQSQFGPIRVGSRIWIIPSWHRDDFPSCPDGLDESAIRIGLDPGLAFGTGSHPTTSLCIEWLDSHVRGGETLLDYGCGTGILAMVGRKLGAGKTWAVDIDPQAVQAARDNSAANQVSLEACLPDDLPAGEFQILVANILSRPLMLMAPMLSARVARGGLLALSGILERQTSELVQAYAPWIRLEAWAEREGWVCLAGRKA